MSEIVSFDYDKDCLKIAKLSPDGAETVSYTDRYAFGQNYGNAPYINPMLRPLKAPEGYMYKWVSMGVLASPEERLLEESKENVRAHALGGWHPVPHARYPDMPEENGFIVYKNQILSEWELPVGIEENRDFADIAIRQMTGIEPLKTVVTEAVAIPLNHLSKRHQKNMEKYITFKELQISDL